MFGEDNFSDAEDYSIHYHEIGGGLETEEINNIIRSIYSFLEKIYPDKQYQHKFPSIKNTLEKIINIEISDHEVAKIIDTFAYHEIGYIPDKYIEVLHSLNKNYRLSVVIDIWSPKSAWLNLFKIHGIDKLFLASSFSSDHGMVKPSPGPFELVINKLSLPKEECLVIGDSVRRDLGGASAAKIDCVLVGGANHSDAAGCYENLIELSHDLLRN
ncbi:hypothetical protein MNBD_GAMMA21-1473 [hydrothermal vent metagenome]|uniref:Uncharacterized protein n=1 Tax=hydrothermal vent metagenome TaxID=652676 RepID=A0A3B1AS13_9ZZZZ